MSALILHAVINPIRGLLRAMQSPKPRVSPLRKLITGVVLVPLFGLLVVVLRVRLLLRGPIEIEGRLTNGLRLQCHLPDLIQMYIYMFGVWEPDQTAYVEDTLKEGDTFIDVGANVGYYSIVASRPVGSSGRVVAIEASPAISRALSDTLDRNGSPPNVRIVQAAVSDRRGTLQLYAGPQQNLGLTTPVKGRGLTPGEEVPAYPLGELLQPDELARARLIKIDVEGGEPQVLHGMLGVVSQLARDVEILVELSPMWWDVASLTADAVLEPWVQAGFNVYEIPNNYWPWRYLWPRDVRRPVRVRRALTRRVKRYDIVLSRRDLEVL